MAQPHSLLAQQVPWLSGSPGTECVLAGEELGIVS